MSLSIRDFAQYVLSPNYRFEYKLAKQVHDPIPKKGLSEIQHKYQTTAPGADDAFICHDNTAKYLDAHHWLMNAVRRATTLNLHKSKPLKILDIGCGAGWFLMVARHLGHTVTGLDLADNLMYNDLIKLMNIDRSDHRILPYEPMPESLQSFDLITAYMIFFNWSGREEGWDEKEWTYFLDDCCSRLNPGGCIRLELNPGRQSDRYRYLPDETADILRKYPGASVNKNKSVITVQQ